MNSLDTTYDTFHKIHCVSITISDGIAFDTINKFSLYSTYHCYLNYCVNYYMEMGLCVLYKEAGVLIFLVLYVYLRYNG